MFQPALERVAVSNRAKGGAASDTSIVTSRAEVAVRLSAGSGTAILLIHSVNGSSAQFNHLFETPFADQYRLIAIDLPGHGHSGEAYDTGDRVDVEGYADIALEVLERSGIDNAFVVDRLARRLHRPRTDDDLPGHARPRHRRRRAQRETPPSPAPRRSIRYSKSAEHLLALDLPALSRYAKPRWRSNAAALVRRLRRIRASRRETPARLP